MYETKQHLLLVAGALFILSLGVVVATIVMSSDKEEAKCINGVLQGSVLITTDSKLSNDQLRQIAKSVNGKLGTLMPDVTAYEIMYP